MSGFSIRLTHKVMAIGLFGLVGLVAFGAIYEVGSLSQDASRGVANRARAIDDLNKQLLIEMLEARRDEKNFQQRRTESYAKAHAELIGPINRDFDEVQRLMVAGGMSALSDRMKQAQEGFKRYASDFSALVAAEIRLGLNETLGLSGSLRAAVHDIEAKLKEIDDPRSTTWMLMMRRHEKDFMLRRDPKYIAEVKKAGVEFSKAIEVVAVSEPVMNDIMAKLGKYQSEFAAWAEAAQQSAALDASMMKTFREIEPVMVEVRTAVDAMYKQADAAEATTRDAVRFWMIIAFGITVVVLAVVGFLLGRSISKALGGMVGAMTRLARGELSISVPGVGRKDEIGEMAGAVEVFRTNMAEAERLRAEQVEADARGREQRKADMQRLADEVRRRGRRDHRDRVVGGDRARGVFEHADAGRRARQRACERRGVGLGGGLRQRAVGVVGERGDDLIDLRDQPPGAGIGARRRRRGRSRRSAPMRASPS